MKVLICAARPLPELEQTLVFREGVERLVAPSVRDAMREADSRPDLAIVDSELKDAEALIETLRAREATRRLPVAVLLAEGTEPQRTRALASLANVFLEPPAGAAWDALLQRISKVATRQDVRVPVRLDLSGTRGASRVTGLAHNLSRSGMLVECVLALPLGEDLRFSLTLPSSDAPVKGRGMVVREQAAGAGGVSCYGVAFDSFEADGQERISSLIGDATGADGQG